MSPDTDLQRAISRAELLLPGCPAPPRKHDPRWQAIIRVAEFIESHPEAVCSFALKWAKVRGVDHQRAISCCLIEHLLEHHFEIVFPIMRREALKNARVAEHFNHYTPYFKFGQAELPKNAARLKRLSRDLQRQANKSERRMNRKSSVKK